MKQERWRTCISHVDAGLGWIASRFFIEAAFSQRARDIGDHIVSHIKEAIVEKLKAAESMDKEVIDLAVEKVRHISHQIGYPTANVRPFPPAEPNTVLTILDPGDHQSRVTCELLQECRCRGLQPLRKRCGDAPEQVPQDMGCSKQASRPKSVASDHTALL
jgi:hypothetical protein